MQVSYCISIFCTEKLNKAWICGYAIPTMFHHYSPCSTWQIFFFCKHTHPFTRAHATGHTQHAYIHSHTHILAFKRGPSMVLSNSTEDNTISFLIDISTFSVIFVFNSIFVDVCNFTGQILMWIFTAREDVGISQMHFNTSCSMLRISTHQGQSLV